MQKARGNRLRTTDLEDTQSDNFGISRIPEEKKLREAISPPGTPSRPFSGRILRSRNIQISLHVHRNARRIVWRGFLKWMARSRFSVGRSRPFQSAGAICQGERIVEMHRWLRRKRERKEEGARTEKRRVRLVGIQTRRNSTAWQGTRVRLDGTVLTCTWNRTYGTCTSATRLLPKRAQGASSWKKGWLVRRGWRHTRVRTCRCNFDYGRYDYRGCVIQFVFVSSRSLECNPFFFFLSDTTLVPRHLSHRPSWTAPLLSSFFWLESSCSFPDCALMRVWKGSWTTQWNSTRQSAIHAGLRWMKMSLFAKLVGICGNDPPTTILLIVLLRFKDLRNCSRDGLIIGDFSFLYSKYFFSYVLKITHFEYLLSLKLIDAELIILNFSGQTLTVYFMEILC